MAGSLNKVILIGNVGKEPEVKHWPSDGKKYATFSLATTQRWTDKTSGEKKEATEWHNIHVNSDVLVGIVERYVKKGSKLAIEGSLRSRKYMTKEGQERYITEVMIQSQGSLVLLDKKEEQYEADMQHSNTRYKEGFAVSLEDDELPF